MKTKFRLTANQLNELLDIQSLYVLGYCGTAEYSDGDEQYFAFSLASSYKLKSIEPNENLGGNGFVPVIFISDDLSPASISKIDSIFKLQINNYGIKGLSVWISDGNIKSLFVHFMDKQREVGSWAIIGSDIQFCSSEIFNYDEDMQIRTKQAFGNGTSRLLASMSIGVIGVSGTGSPMVEMLYRTGVGELVLIDPDTVEKKNLNRILNAGTDDADSHTCKVNVIKQAIVNYGFSTKVEALPINLFSKRAVKALSRCDVIFGCTDTADSRSLLNALAKYYCIPYFDVGVNLDADGKGNIKSICAAVNYIMPDGCSLEKRGSITNDEVLGATLYRTSKEQYQQQVKEHYIKGVKVDSPAVLCVNMAASSFAFLDFMARIHRIRSESNSQYERTYIDYTNMRLVFDPVEFVAKDSIKNLGYGDTEPLLGRTELSGEVE